MGDVRLASCHMPFVVHSISSVFVSGGGPISSAASLLSNSFTFHSACVVLSAYCTMLSGNDDPLSSIALYAPPVPNPSCPIVVPPFVASIFSYSAIKCLLNSIHCWRMVLYLRFHLSVASAYSPPSQKQGGYMQTPMKGGISRAGSSANNGWNSKRTLLPSMKKFSPQMEEQQWEKMYMEQGGHKVR